MPRLWCKIILSHFASQGPLASDKPTWALLGHATCHTGGFPFTWPSLACTAALPVAGPACPSLPCYSFYLRWGVHELFSHVQEEWGYPDNWRMRKAEKNFIEWWNSCHWRGDLGAVSLLVWLAPGFYGLRTGEYMLIGLWVCKKVKTKAPPKGGHNNVKKQLGSVGVCKPGEGWGSVRGKSTRQGGSFSVQSMDLTCSLAFRV